MADLVAIGYPDETTASRAAAEADRLCAVLGLEADAIATIVRDREGRYHVSTSHHFVSDGTSWGMFWGPLFGLVFFVPVLGMAVGNGLAALLRAVDRAVVEHQFQSQVRDMLQPGTSALFLVVERVTPDRAVDALRRFGGTVLRSPLSTTAEAELQKDLHGTTVAS